MDAKEIAVQTADRVQKVAKYLEVIINLNKEFFKIVVKGVEKPASITEQEIKILAYAATMGDINTMKSRTGCQNYLGISRHSLNNAISKLQRVGLLVKVDNRTRLHENLRLDFSKKINLILRFNEQTRDSTDSSGETSD